MKNIEQATSAITTTYAWIVAFINGHVGFSNKTNSNYVRCVRNPNGD